MKKIIILIVSMLLFSGCIKEKMEGADLKVGDILPDFEVVMSDGTVVSDDILKETISVVVFFHTSCPDCQQVLPQMQKIYSEYLSAGISFAFISREETAASIDTFWKSNALEMPYSAQNDRSVYQKFAKEGIPRVYINEKGGIIRYVFTDDPNPSYDEICTALENVIR